MLLSRLEEAEAGERAAMLEASRVGEDNERLKVGQAMFESDDCYHRLSHRIGACNFPSLCFFLISLFSVLIPSLCIGLVAWLAALVIGTVEVCMCVKLS